jgi:hypothetical protein
MTKIELVALANRCERALGPDRELDARIVEALGYRRTVEREGKVWRYYGSGPLGNIERLAKATLPRYTASLDAAMTLIEPDWAFSIDNGPCHWICLGEEKPMGRCDIKYPKPDYDGEGDSWITVRAIAATPALALCAASLKAIASQEDDASELGDESTVSVCRDAIDEIDRLNALLGEARDYLQRLADHQQNTRGDMLYKGYADDELISLLTKLGEGSRCGAEQ